MDGAYSTKAVAIKEALTIRNHKTEETNCLKVSLAPSLTLSGTPSLYHSLAHSLCNSLTHSLTYSLTHSYTHSSSPTCFSDSICFTHSSIYDLGGMLQHGHNVQESLSPSLTHPLAH